MLSLTLDTNPILDLSELQRDRAYAGNFGVFRAVPEAVGPARQWEAEERGGSP